jgi:AraC-like DNA-binding protein/mannose-6-phosphate isomerase-like protein (cupin superfamily)
MECVEILNKLVHLDAIERFGKRHIQIKNCNLSQWQYAYLLYTNSIPTDIGQLYSEESLKEQEHVKEYFFHRFGTAGLSTQDFFAESHNLEIEKLPRYVSIAPHRHEFVELVFVLRGTCSHTVNGFPFTQSEGDLVFVSSGATHELIANDDTLCLTLKIRSEFFRSFELPGMLNFITPLLLRCSSDHFIRDCFLILFQEQATQHPYCNSIMEKLTETVLTYAMEHYGDTLQYLLSDPAQDSFFFQLLNYIAENHRTVTLRSVAEHFHYNPTYLSNYLNKKYGYTFSLILRNYRLDMAEKLLCDTNMKLNDICDTIGYKDTPQFIRSFKERFGMTPAKYRKAKKLNASL